MLQPDDLSAALRAQGIKDGPDLLSRLDAAPAQEDVAPVDNFMDRLRKVRAAAYRVEAKLQQLEATKYDLDDVDPDGAPTSEDALFQARTDVQARRRSGDLGLGFHIYFKRTPPALRRCKRRNDARPPAERRVPPRPQAQLTTLKRHKERMRHMERMLLLERLEGQTPKVVDGKELRACASVPALPADEAALLMETRSIQAGSINDTPTVTFSDEVEGRDKYGSPVKNRGPDRSAVQIALPTVRPNDDAPEVSPRALARSVTSKAAARAEARIQRLEAAGADEDVDEAAEEQKQMSQSIEEVFQRFCALYPRPRRKTLPVSPAGPVSAERPCRTPRRRRETRLLRGPSPRNVRVVRRGGAAISVEYPTSTRPPAGTASST